MGMGAPKQGTTLNLNSGQQVPVQGGKGGGRPMPMPPQGGKGAGQPVQLGKGVGRPVQPGQYPGQYPRQYPYTPIGAQGGKGGTSNVPGQPQTTLNLNSGQQVPVQGGKGGTSNVPGYAQPYVNSMMDQPLVQQPAAGVPMQGIDMSKYSQSPSQFPPPNQIPAQGGKAPLTPEQHAAISANADPVRGLGLNLGDMLYGGGQPQVLPQKPGTPAPGLNGVPGNQNPRYFGPGKPALAPVMPRPMPQVMPRQPTPKPAPQGLAQIQQMLAGQQPGPGRPAPAPGLNGVPGNQNPLYFGPGRK